MHMAIKTSQQYVVAWRQHVDSSFALHSHASSHDTKIIFQAIKAKERGATQLDVYSPDTNVFILLIRRSPQFPKETSFVTYRSKGHNREEYRLRRYMMNLSQQKQLPCQDFMHLQKLTLEGLWKERKVLVLENIQPSR